MIDETQTTAMDPSTDEALEELVNGILQYMDKNIDGYVDYSEFKMYAKRAETWISLFQSKFSNLYPIKTVNN